MVEFPGQYQSEDANVRKTYLIRGNLKQPQNGGVGGVFRGISGRGKDTEMRKPELIQEKVMIFACMNGRIK